VEGFAAREHLVGDDREGEEVRVLRHVSPGDLLGRHVGGRAENLPGPREPRRLEVGDAEIHELRPAVVQHHDVRGLQVAVDDSVPVEVVEGVRDGREDRDGLVRREQLPSGEDLLEGRALEVLHHEVVVTDVEDREDVGMGEPADGLRLPPEALEIFGGGLAGQVLGADRFDRDSALDEGVKGAVDPPHGPLADLLHDLIAAEGFREALGSHSNHSGPDVPSGRGILVRALMIDKSPGPRPRRP
jgi:hypothetical protein